MIKYLILLITLTACTTLPSENEMNKKYLYLEEIQGKESLNFANSLSAKTKQRYELNPKFKSIKEDILKDLNDPEKIPYGSIHGEYVYNFWKDKKNPRGLWRRMTLKSYIVGKSKWEILINVDKLAAKEKKNWIWKRPNIESTKYRKAIVSLSIGGKDAKVMREFDLRTKTFVKNGFNIFDEGKNYITWIDENNVFVSANYGPGTVTKAGYPRQSRYWKRGQTYKQAKLINEIPENYSYGYPYYDRKVKKTIFIITPQRYQYEYYHFDDKNKKILGKLPLPKFVEIEERVKNRLLLSTREKWNIGNQDYLPGDLISVNEDQLINGDLITELVFRPNKRQSLQSIYSSKSRLYISLLNDVKQEIRTLTLKNNQWLLEKLKLPDSFARSYIKSISNNRDDFFITQASFTKPYTLYYFKDGKFNFVRKQKSKFNDKDLKVEQYFAKSKDGTLVPYFQVSKKNIKLDGNNPTEVYAYGGFQHAKLPFYSGSLGKHWLEKGGVFVLANIRGGSEYGVRWHKDALKEKRQNAFNDFYAVAEDLIKRKVSSPKKLAARGGSNGGLLTAVAMTQRPDLYNAIVSAVPLTDMERFHKLLAGHSWVGEYGDPEKEEEKNYLLKYSPYHQLEKEQDYPIPFVFTSTLDDRVHPGHARKFVAKMKDLGHDVIYYENTEGGHAGSSNYNQRASIKAMQYLYLYERLGMK